MTLAALITGYADLAEWLVLFAVVAFAAAAALAYSSRPDPTHRALVPIGLALSALAWLVL